MRVLHLVQRPQRRGAEMFAYDLSRRFEEIGVDVGTIYLYAHDRGESLPLHEHDRCLRGMEGNPLERVPGFEPLLLGKVIGAIRRFQPDIVQVNGARTVKYGAAARILSRGDWKLVYRNIGMASHWHRWKGSIAAYRKVIIPRMDGVIGVSAASLEDVTEFYGLRAPSEVILNGINAERLTPAVSREDFRREQGVKEGEVVLLSVGSLDAAKRPDRFLRVFARVAEESPGTWAWLVGDGPERAEMERLARVQGLESRVRFFGSRADVADFMQAADIFVMTSDTEGVPAVVLEAGLLGLPVVAPRIGGLPECIADGRTGVLVPPGDERRMGDAIVRLIADPEARSRLGRGGREWVSGHLTIEHVAERYLAFYRELLDGRIAVPA